MKNIVFVILAIAGRAIALSTATSGFLAPLLLLLPAQPSYAQVFEGIRGCPLGTQEGNRNFILNGTFNRNAGTGDGVATVPAAVPPRQQCGICSVSGQN